MAEHNPVRVQMKDNRLVSSAPRTMYSAESLSVFPQGAGVAPDAVPLWGHGDALLQGLDSSGLSVPCTSFVAQHPLILLPALLSPVQSKCQGSASSSHVMGFLPASSSGSSGASSSSRGTGYLRCHTRPMFSFL